MCGERAFRGDTELLPRGEGGSEDDLSVFLFLLLVVLVLFLFLILYLRILPFDPGP